MRSLGKQSTYGLLLAIIAICILVLGYVLRPAPSQKTAQSLPEITAIKSEVIRLRELAERNTLRNTSSRLARVATEAAEHLIFIPSLRTSGVIWNDDAIVGPAGNIAPGKGNSRAPIFRSALSGAGIPLQILRPNSGQTLTSPVTLAGATETPGAWILAVSIDGNNQVHFSPGNLSGYSNVSCGALTVTRVETNLPFDRSSLGSAVFDLDEQLVGIVLNCDVGPAVVSVDSMQKAMNTLTNPRTGPALALGFRASTVPDDWQKILGGSGVFVTDVWRGSAAHQAGLLPGDLVSSINGQQVGSLDDLGRLLSSGAQVQLQVRRLDRPSIRVQLPGENDRGALAPVEFAATPRGIQLEQVTPGSTAEAAGLLPGDRVLAVNGISATESRVLHAFSVRPGSPPTLMTVQRGDRFFAVLVKP
jgi:S1-C subfamily serine protease